MLLWTMLFVLLLSIFTAAALVWWRVETNKRRQKLVKGILAGVNPDAPVVTTTSTLLPVPESGLKGAFKRGTPADPGTGSPEWSLGTVLIVTVLMAFAGLLVGSKMASFLGSVAPIIGTVAFGAIPWAYRSKQRGRWLSAIEDQFPDALDFLSRSVRAGNAFSVGLELLGAEISEPLKPEILKVVREMALGASLEEALNGLIARVPLLEIRFFISAVLLQRETGGNLSEILGKLGTAVRERLRLRGHIKAASGQARLTAAVLTVLPVATLIMLTLISPGYMKNLTTDPLGQNILAAAVVSQIIGYIVMQKIVKIEV